MSQDTFNLNQTNEKRPHCGRPKGKHKAQTLNCPFGRGNFPQFYPNQVFKAVKKRVKK